MLQALMRRAVHPYGAATMSKSILTSSFTFTVPPAILMGAIPKATLLEGSGAAVMIALQGNRDVDRPFLPMQR